MNPKYKISQKRGVFWRKNDPEINYGQTGTATFLNKEQKALVDDKIWFRPDGGEENFLVPIHYIYFPEEHSYYFGVEADERIKNLQKEIFGCK